MQLYAHEYFHFFQALSFETLQYQSYILRYKVKYEAICFLKSFDKGIRPIFNFRRDEYNEETSLLQLVKKINDENLIKQIEDLSEKYEYYINIWNYRKEGISLLSIIESMAHIYSLKVNNSSDVLNLEQNNIYTNHLNIF